MADKNTIMALIYDVADETNEVLQQEKKIVKDPATPLLARGSVIDSLTFVNFITAVEAALDDELGIHVSLTDEKAMSQQHSPFRSLDSLAEYILENS